METLLFLALDGSVSLQTKPDWQASQLPLGGAQALSVAFLTQEVNLEVVQASIYWGRSDTDSPLRIETELEVGKGREWVKEKRGYI